MTHHSHHDFQDQVTSQMHALEKWMAPLFAKLPHLPDSSRKTVKDLSPWIALVVGILGFIGLLGAGVMSMILSPFILFTKGVPGLFTFVFLALGLIACVLDLLAFNPLLKGHKKGWNYLFYGTVLTTISVALQILLGEAALVSLLLMLVGFWLLFEIRGLYR